MEYFKPFPKILVFAVIYFMPSIVGRNRDHKNKLGIFVLNLALGWTLIGWLVALIWACSGQSCQVSAPDAHKRIAGLLTVQT